MASGGTSHAGGPLVLWASSVTVADLFDARARVSPDRVAVEYVERLHARTTPSAIAARLVCSSAPEAIQGAVAAGLLGVGSVFAGTVEGCAAILARLVASKDIAAEARAVAEAHRAERRPIPGFGHPQHKLDDQRTPRILGVAEQHGVAGAHVSALRELASAVDAVYGKHVTVNATGATAAVLSDCGVRPEILRGFSLIARCAGLVGHVHEEQQAPAIPALWRAGEVAVPYKPLQQR
jgi:citrate synthase